MINRIIIMGLVFGLLSAIQLFIPDSFSTGIDSAIIFFIQKIYLVGYIINVDTVILVMRILINFQIAIITLLGLKWLFKLAAHS